MSKFDSVIGYRAIKQELLEMTAAKGKKKRPSDDGRFFFV